MIATKIRNVAKKLFKISPPTPDVFGSFGGLELILGSCGTSFL